MQDFLTRFRAFIDQELAHLAQPALPGIPHPGLPPAVQSAPPMMAPPMTAPPAAMPAAPPAAMTAPPVAPPAAPPPAAAPAAVADTPEDEAVKAQGWTLDHLRQQATAFTQKYGAAGPEKLTQIASTYLPGDPRPAVSKIPARHWPAVFAALQG